MLRRLATIALLFAACATGSNFASDENPTEKQDLLRFTEKWSGDFDGMRKRRKIRALVTLNKLFYFLDGPVQRGEAYELLKEFEAFVNKKLKTSTLGIEVIFIPVGRDQLLPRLIDGRGDIAAANLTITKERRKLVDFSDPFLTNVSEVLVTGPAGPKISTVDDLSGKEIHVRRSASYFEHLTRLNASFRRRGLREVKIVAADENLEDEDILEMVNASLIPMTIVDSHKAQFWKDIFDHITVHENIAVNTGGQIAWAFRKGSPQLKAMINQFVAGHKKGTLLGNILYKRYLRENKWVRNSLADSQVRKFKATIAYFKKYAGKYDFDWLLVAAQGYQESGLDQSKRSPVGAIGVMQLLPSTAADPNVNIPNIHVLENNIHAGTKYLRFLIDQYFADTTVDKLNQHLFALAAYNAGPARVAELRKEAAKLGLNPDVWFDNVEIVAARRVGRETVQYVRNIYKYYIAYRLVVDQLENQRRPTATAPKPAESRVSACGRPLHTLGQTANMNYQRNALRERSDDANATLFRKEDTVMIKGLHHNAYRCRDSEETRRFYEDFLGLPLVNAFEIAETKTGRKTRVLHSFYQMDDGSCLAFFEAPDYPFEFKDQHDYDLHIALEVGRETLDDMFARGKAEGIETRGISDHGFIHSIYFRDPNGYVIELAARTTSDDVPLDEARKSAREALDAWQNTK